MKYHHSGKRRICLLLVLVMILGMMPLGVFAGEESPIVSEGIETEQEEVLEETETQVSELPAEEVQEENAEEPEEIPENPEAELPAEEQPEAELPAEEQLEEEPQDELPAEEMQKENPQEVSEETETKAAELPAEENSEGQKEELPEGPQTELPAEEMQEEIPAQQETELPAEEQQAEIPENPEAELPAEENPEAELPAEEQPEEQPEKLAPVISETPEEIVVPEPTFGMGFLLAPVLFMKAPLPENTFYVSASGSDTEGNGSVEAPFASLDAAYDAIESEGTIALLSDIRLTDTAHYSNEASLYVASGKKITLTSADAEGYLLDNEAGDMDGVYTIHRWNSKKTDCYKGCMAYVNGGSLTLKQIVLDGGAKNFTASAGRGYLVFVLGKYGDDELTLDTNCILQDNIDLGTAGVPCGAGVVFGSEHSSYDPKMYMKSNAAIIGCIAPRHGGALTVYDGDFYMMDDTVMMYNGIKWIGDTYYGGGAILAYRGHVHMSGNAVITKNFVNVPAGKDSGRQHNAMQADPNTASIVYISGNARIFDNYDGTDTSLTKSGDTYILTGTRQANAYGAAGKFYVDGELGSKAKIGVTVKDAADGSTVVYGSGYTLEAEDANAFFDDSNTYKVVKGSSNQLVFSSELEVATMTLGTLTNAGMTVTFDKNIGVSAKDFTVFHNGVKLDESAYSVAVSGTEATISFDEELEDYDTIGIAVYKNGCKVNGGLVVNKTLVVPAEIEIGTFKQSDGKFRADISLAGRMRTYSVSITGGKIYLTSVSGSGYAFKNGVVSSITGHATPNTNTGYTSLQLEVTAGDTSIDAVASAALESLRYTSTDGETFTVEIAGAPALLSNGDYYINGHYYTLSSSVTNWKAAMEWAFNLQSSDGDRYPGYKSYPAVITTAEENQMLVTIWTGSGGTRRQIWLPAVPANPKSGTGSITVSGEEGNRTVTVTGEPQANVITNEYGHGEAYVWLDGTPEAGQPLPNETPLMGKDINKKGYFWSSQNPTNGGSVYFGHPGQGAFWDDISDQKGYGSNVWTQFSGNASFKMYALAEWEPENESNEASDSRTFSHTHNWSYTADGDTITATCTASDCYLEETTQELVISAPESLICNGRYKGASLSADSVGSVTDLDGTDIVYEKKDKNGEYQEFEEIPYLEGSYRASISAGGVSAEVEYTLTVPVLTAVQGADSGNFADLSWDGVSGSKYMIEKAETGETFQTISLKNSIKVLNVYPNAGDNLQTWMNTGSLGSPTVDGVKYSMTVDKVSLSNFNSSPENYLGTAGNWKYDVIFFGAWDSNNGMDISNAAYTLTDTFVRCGGGVLLGHDTAYPGHTNFAKLAASYLDIICSSSVKYYGYTQVRISKKGTLTNYPYNIGEPGTILNIPMSHTTNQFVTDGIWMEFTANSWSGGAKATSCGGKTGTNTFYLTTKNNVAMIQTGHSGGSATLDEQKVLVNTLYYLAQSTDADSFQDHSAQDLTAPGLLTDGTIAEGKFSFTEPEDSGNTYTYKLYGIDDTTGARLYTGASASCEVITGLAGYSYVLSPSASSIGLDNTVETSENVISLDAYEGGTCYLHICAVDNAGNTGVEQIFDITHIHEWSYEGSGSTITATCADTLGTCRAKTADKVLTIMAPEDPVYNGGPRPARLSASYVGGVTDLSTSDITYEKLNEDESFSPMAGKPTEKGIYRASITVSGETASVIYRIKNQCSELTASMFLFEAPDILEYDGTGKGAGVEPKESYIGKIGTIGNIRYLKDGETTFRTEAVEPGTYTVWIDLGDDGDVYGGGKDITFPNWTFTILPREITASWTDTTQIFTGEELQPTANLSNILPGDEVEISGITRTEAGSYMLTAEIDNPNYVLTNPKTAFVIQKAPVKFSVEDTILPYDGEPGEPVISVDLPEGTYTIIYKDKDGNPVEDPTEPGTYTIYAVITDGNFRFDDTPDGNEHRISSLTIYGDTAPQTYAVSFADGGGCGTMDDLDPVVAGDLRTLPACGFTRDGYSFTGWLYDKTLYKAGETFTQPDEDAQLTAQWSNNVFLVSGVVRDGSPVSDAVVTLMSGSRVIAQQITGEDGTFSFDGILPGIYNLTISYDGIIVTTTIAVGEDADCDDIPVSLPAGRTNSVVEIAAGSPEIIVSGLPENFEEIGEIFTEEDQQLIEEGGTVELKLSLSENTCPSAEKQAELKKKAGASSVVIYLNADLEKTMTDADGTVCSAQPVYSVDSLLTLIIPVPAELQNMSDYSVFRFHSPDGSAEKETFEELYRISAAQAGKKEGYTVSKDGTYVTVYAKNFSLYAIYCQPKSTTRRMVNIPQDTRGTVSVSPVRAACGKLVTVTVDPRDGYSATGIVVTGKDGSRIAVKDNGDGTYTFVMPAMEVSIEVLYSRALASLDMTGVSGWLITDRQVPYMSGYTDGTVRPETTITRAETAMIFYRLLKQKDMTAVAAQEEAFSGAEEAMPGIEDAEAISIMDEPASGAAEAETLSIADEAAFSIADEPASGAAEETALGAAKSSSIAKAEDSGAGKTSFTDVDEDQWYSTAVNTLARMGILSGYTDGSFRPDACITRAEFTAIAMKFANAVEADAHFSDVKAGFWAENSILSAATYGWINGYADGTFRPAEDITRAEAAVIVNKMLCRSAASQIVLAGNFLKKFADLADSTKWYFGDMLAATREDEYYANAE